MPAKCPDRIVHHHRMGKIIFYVPLLCEKKKKKKTRGKRARRPRPGDLGLPRTLKETRRAQHRRQSRRDGQRDVFWAA